MSTQSNAQIIFNESMELMKEGKIGSTGRIITVTVEKNGQKVQEKVKEPEPIHTYKEWQRLGFQVEKGQKAIAVFTIWNFAENKKDADEEEAPSLMKNGYYYMKKAAFFKLSQVKKAGDDNTAAKDPEGDPEPAPVKKEAPAKSKTPCTQKAFDYIVKSASKNTSTRLMNGMLNGSYYACDGFQVMKTKNPVCENEILSHISDNLDQMLSTTKDFTAAGSIGLTAKEVKAGIKEAKNGRRNAKVVYTTAEGITLNADFLYNAILATGSSRYTYADAKKPVRFECPQTEYMLCPVNCQDKALSEGFHVIG